MWQDSCQDPSSHFTRSNSHQFSAHLRLNSIIFSKIITEQKLPWSLLYTLSCLFRKSKPSSRRPFPYETTKSKPRTDHSCVCQYPFTHCTHTCTYPGRENQCEVPVIFLVKGNNTITKPSLIPQTLGLKVQLAWSHYQYMYVHCTNHLLHNFIHWKTNNWWNY